MITLHLPARFAMSPRVLRPALGAALALTVLMILLTPRAAVAQTDCDTREEVIQAGIESVSDSTISLQMQPSVELQGCNVAGISLVIRWPELTDPLAIDVLENGTDMPTLPWQVLDTATDGGFVYAWLASIPASPPAADFAMDTVHEMVKVGYNRSGAVLVELVPTTEAQAILGSGAGWGFQYTTANKANNTDEFFNSGTELPVELTALTAQQTDEAVHLTWRTASETNNAGFDIERRIGRTRPWNRIGFAEGAGTTVEPQTYTFTDGRLPYEAEIVIYRLRQVDLDGSVAYSDNVEVEMAAPTRLALGSNFPNPFTERTTIRYELPEHAEVRLTVYDVLGREVATLVQEPQPAGRYTVVFNAGDTASGMYIYRLHTADHVETRRMLLIR